MFLYTTYTTRRQGDSKLFGFTEINSLRVDIRAEQAQSFFFAYLSNTLEQLRAEMMHVLKKQRETGQKAPSRIYIPQITKPFTSFLLDTLPSSKHLKLTQ
jgi:hypothetical protein